MTSPARQLAPDVARGLALAFIAIANVMPYLHGRPYGLRQHLIEDGPLDRAVSFVTVAAIDCRIYPLFSLLLGYGIARMAARGERHQPERRIRWRGLGLLLFGAVHGILLFSGDILGFYGLVTILLLPALHWPTRRLLGWAAALVVPFSAVQGFAFSDVGPTLQRSLFWSMGISDPVEALLWRIPEWAMGMLGMLGVVPAVLVGFWAGRRNLLAAPQDHRRLLASVGIVGALVGLLGGLPAALVVAGVVSIDSGIVAVVFSVAHVATGIFGGIGYAALIGLACGVPAFAASRFADVMTAVGQRSLTCYLLQSVLMVPLLPAWTLALGGVLGTAQAALFAIAVYLVTVAIALLLRSWGDRRPAETLLRRFAQLSDRRAEPLRA